MKRSLWKITAVAAVAALSLTACASGSGDDETPSQRQPDRPRHDQLHVVGQRRPAARYQEALDLFKEQYPYITVQTSFAAFPDYWTQRSTEAARPGLYDVMQFDLSYLREFNQNGQAPRPRRVRRRRHDRPVGLRRDPHGVRRPRRQDDRHPDVHQHVRDVPGTRPSSPRPAPSSRTTRSTWEDYNEFIADASSAGARLADGYALYGAVDYTGTFWFFIQVAAAGGHHPVRGRRHVRLRRGRRRRVPRPDGRPARRPASSTRSTAARPCCPRAASRSTSPRPR